MTSRKRPFSGSGESRGHPEPVERLIDQFAMLPGIGRRSAERMAFHILKATPEDALRLSQAIADVKQNVRSCSICFNLTDVDPCRICSDPQRDASLVLVVEQPRDLISLEQTGMFSGVYHVLMGRLDPLNGVDPEHLTVGRLFERVKDSGTNSRGVAVREVILGTNPNMEGDGTALYLSDELSRRGVKVTRLARGLPAGSQLEYASKAVLADAIQGRQQMT
jgi:recombination protein RecR